MASTRYGISCWVDGVAKGRRPEWARLRGDHEHDVVVVGGGLAGCMTAFLFAQAGVRVAVLEASRMAQAATAGGPGLFDAGAGARFLDLRERYGLRVARHMWDQERRASLDAQALVRRLRIRCDLARLDLTDIAVTDADAGALEREHRALEEAGFGAAWLTGARARAATGLGAVAALKRREAGWADPFRLALGLAMHAQRRGAVLHEQTPVRRVRVAKGHAEVVTESGTLRASHVVIASGLPQPGLGALHRHLRPVETTVAMVPPLPAPVRRTFGTAAGILRDCAEPRHAWRLGRDGTLVVWQPGQPPVPGRKRDAAAVGRTGQLMYELSLLYPAISGLQPAFGWTAPSCRSLDGLVIAGPHRSFPRHLFAVGLGADGLQSAYLAARINLRSYLGAPEKGDELFGFVR